MALYSPRIVHTIYFIILYLIPIIISDHCGSYVSSNGSDSPSCGTTEDTPCQTLLRAADVKAEGDLCIMDTVKASGTISNSISVRPWKSERVALDCDDTPLLLTQGLSITFENITFQNLSAGIWFTDVENVTIDGCDFVSSSESNDTTMLMFANVSTLIFVYNDLQCTYGQCAMSVLSRYDNPVLVFAVNSWQGFMEILIQMGSGQSTGWFTDNMGDSGHLRFSLGGTSEDDEGEKHSVLQFNRNDLSSMSSVIFYHTACSWAIRNSNNTVSDSDLIYRSINTSPHLHVSFSNNTYVRSTLSMVQGMQMWYPDFMSNLMIGSGLFIDQSDEVAWTISSNVFVNGSYVEIDTVPNKSATFNFYYNYFEGSLQSAVSINDTGNSTFYFSDQIFRNNSAKIHLDTGRSMGGAVYVHVSTGNPSPVIFADSEFRGNSAGYKGAAVYAHSAAFSKCKFEDNRAGHGGIVHLTESASFDSCKFKRNYAGWNSAADIRTGWLKLYNTEIDVEPSNYFTIVDHPSQSDIDSLTCPDGYIFQIDSLNGETGYGCRLCSGNTYTLGRGEYRKGAIDNPPCYSCPIGALCTTERVSVEPNMWCGVYDNSTATCYECPKGYCPSEIHEIERPCDNDRAGILCGKCRENYSVSMMSPKCLPNSHCNRWWWLVWLAYPVLWTLFLVYVPIAHTADWKCLIFLVQLAPLVAEQARPITSIGVFFFSSHSVNRMRWGTGWNLCLGENMSSVDKVGAQIGMTMLPFCLALFISFTMWCKRVARDRKRDGYNVIRESIFFFRRRSDSHIGTNPPSSPEISARFRWGRGVIATAMLTFTALFSLCWMMLRCQQINDRSRLFIDAERVCWQTPRHYIVFILFTGLVMSPLLLWLVRKIAAKNTDSEVARAITFVLEDSYRLNFPFWDSVTIAFRIICAGCALFLSDEYKAISLTVFTALYSLITIIVRPFSTIRGNIMAIITSLCLTAVATAEMFGLYSYNWPVVTSVGTLSVVFGMVICIAWRVWVYVGTKLWIGAQAERRPLI
ncbi:hypothetical protein PROFUN_06905 [Planoprotostelium fungivorum]|uniref:Adhesin-like protein n=1 Tax=Planoprotostelium fungivorum TaxID=1890364 RepID=A0A2P6NMW0_9EUKA|nr:hypothetical protein PROFUN_06905 [Planoprotostelium fungivorum]